MAKDDCHLLVKKLSFTGNAAGVYLGKIAGNTLHGKQVKFSPKDIVCYAICVV